MLNRSDLLTASEQEAFLPSSSRYHGSYGTHRPIQLVLAIVATLLPKKPITEATMTSTLTTYFMLHCLLPLTKTQHCSTSTTLNDGHYLYLQGYDVLLVYQPFLPPRHGPCGLELQPRLALLHTPGGLSLGISCSSSTEDSLSSSSLPTASSTSSHRSSTSRHCRFGSPCCFPCIVCSSLG